MFRPLVWPLQKIVKEQTSDSLAVITVAKEMQQQQDQTAASRTPQYYDCRIYESLEWNSIWLFFSPLYLSVFLFFLLRSCSSFFPSRTSSDRLFMAAHLLPLLLHSNDRDVENSIIINPLRERQRLDRCDGILREVERRREQRGTG